jgi:hypothetical protein
MEGTEFLNQFLVKKTLIYEILLKFFLNLNLNLFYLGWDFFLNLNLNLNLCL